MGSTRDGPDAEVASPTAGSLDARLRSLADGPDGSIRFDRFMEAALYDPSSGYYTLRSGPTGRPGDFYTAAHLRPLFGHTLGRRVVAEYERLGRPDRFHIVEVGAGDGTLAADLLDYVVSALSAEAKIDYALVEPSARLRARALERLRPFMGRPGVELRLMSGLAAEDPFVGVVVANELLDAFPCRRLVWRDGAWRDLRAAREKNRWQFTESASDEPVPGPALAPSDRDGMVIEITTAGEAFLRQVGDLLEGGAAIFLDYGDEEAALRSRFPHGTLAAVRAHHASEDPLAAPGEQDLSAFVNFTRIRSAARSAGLVERAFRRQSEALTAWGLQAVLEHAIAAASNSEVEVKLRLAAKSLLFGFEQFRVLELGAGKTPDVAVSEPTGPAKE